MFVTQESLTKGLDRVLSVYTDSNNEEVITTVGKQMAQDVGWDHAVVTLSDYYDALDIIRNPGERDGIEQSRLPLYMRIPYDEEYFKINPNSGVITVPSDFVKNGLAIVGDHLAETVFFEVPRYFDTIDLATCAGYDAVTGVHGSIIIHWKNGNMSGSAKALYLDYDEENMWFGWVISGEDSGPASQSGNVEFAVTFILRNNDEVIISEKHTLSARVAIKTTIESDETEADAIDWSSLVNSRPTYSGTANLLSMPAPVVKLNYYPRAAGVQSFGQTNAVSNYEVILQDIENYNAATDPHALLSSSAVSNAGQYVGGAEIVYELFYNGQRITDFINNDEIVIREFQEYKPNWELDKKTGLLTVTIEHPENTHVYNHTLKTLVPGTYYLRIGNKVKKSSNPDRYETRWVDSDITEILAASDFNITNVHMPQNLVIKRDGNNLSSISVSAAFAANEPEVGEFRYQWQRYDTTENAFVAIDNANARTASYVPTVAGLYKVAVTSYYQNSMLTKVSDAIVNAQLSPVAPVFNIDVTNVEAAAEYNEVACSIVNFRNSGTVNENTYPATAPNTEDYYVSFNVYAQYVSNVSDGSTFTTLMTIDPAYYTTEASLNDANSDGIIKVNLIKYLQERNPALLHTADQGFYLITFKGRTQLFTVGEFANEFAVSDAGTVQVRISVNENQKYRLTQDPSNIT